MRESFVILITFGLLSSVPEIVEKGERGVFGYSWEAPFNHTWFYVNEVTFEKSLRMGVVARGTNHDEKVRTFHPNPQFHLWRGLEVESITKGQWFDQFCPCNEAFINIPELHSSESFQVDEQEWTHVPGGWCTPNSTETEALVLQTLPDLALCISSSGSSFISFNILCNKPVTE